MTTPGSHESPARSDDVVSVGERRLIDHIRRRLPPPPASLVVGIGDDAAVAIVDRGALQVLTTDALVEGVHFDRRFSTTADIGYKALAVNVSDIAAMGGAPRLALLSLILPPTLLIDRRRWSAGRVLEAAAGNRRHAGRRQYHAIPWAACRGRDRRRVGEAAPDPDAERGTPGRHPVMSAERSAPRLRGSAG